MTPTDVPAGWYRDPLGSGSTGVRYWDGTQWTRQTKLSSRHWRRGIPEGLESEPVPESDESNVEELEIPQSEQDQPQTLGTSEDPHSTSSAPTVPPRAPLPLKNLAVLAYLGLGINAVIQLLVVSADGNYVGLVNEILDGNRPRLAEINDAEDRLDMVAIAQLVGLLGIATLTFLPWFYRAYSNLERGGIVELSHGKGWAIGAWFVPILNWFRPKQIANDLWRASKLQRDQHWRTDPIPGFLNWWWGLWVAGSVLGTIGVRIATSAAESPTSNRAGLMDALEQERAGYVLDGVASLMLVVAAVLAIRLVRRVTEEQSSTHLNQSGTTRMSPLLTSEMANQAVESWECEICGEAFETKSERETHAAVHHETLAAQVKCPACGDGFTGDEALSAHIAEQHAGEMKWCPDCAEEIPAAARKCRYCGYSFVTGDSTS